MMRSKNSERVLRNVQYRDYCICRPVRLVFLFPTGCNIRFHDFLFSFFFFEFAPAGKNLHTVEFTYLGEFLYYSRLLHKELNKITKCIG